MNDEKRKQILEGKDTFTISNNNISLNELFTKDENNITYLEHACKNRIYFPDYLVNDILNNQEALHICIQCKYVQWLRRITDEEVFFKKIGNEETLLDCACKNNVEIHWDIFKKHTEIIDYIIKYNKYHAIKELTSEITSSLFTKENGIFPIDKYLNNQEMISNIINNAPLPLILEYCKQSHSYDVLKYANENYLLVNIDDDNTVLDVLLDNNIEPLFYKYSFKDPNTFKTLFEKNRFNLLCNANIELLLTPYDGNRTYFDLMVDAHKQGKDVQFEKVFTNFNYAPPEMTAKKLIFMARNNIIGYIPEINQRMLLHKQNDKQKTVIEWLIEMDKDLTISTILPYCTKIDDPKLVIVLKTLGIENVKPKIKIDDNDLADEFIDEFNQTYTENVPSEYEPLLNELRDLFYNDGISDKSIIDTLIISYRYLINKDADFAVAELKRLIEIKKAYPKDFTYTKNSTDSYYFREDKGIRINRRNISTINHETSHALHFLCAEGKIPENFKEIIGKIKNDPETIDRIVDYAVKYLKMKDKIKARISQKEINEYYDKKYSGDKLSKLNEALQTEKEKLKEKLKKEFPEDVIDTILERSFTAEEFISNRKELEETELLNVIFRCEQDAFFVISDILDAIFSGKIFNGVLRDKNGKYIQHMGGHGIAYYSIEEKAFIEIIAQYGVIIKSKHSKEILEYLRGLVGDELVDLLDKFYREEMLHMNEKLEIENSEEENKRHGR